MELGLFRNRKIHKKQCNRHITLMIIPDPTKQAKIIKIPKWFRFPVLAVLVAMVLGSLYLVDHIEQLNCQLVQDRLVIQTSQYGIEDRDVTIEALEVTNATHYDQLEELEALQTELELQLADIQAYKEELDSYVSGTEKTTDEVPDAYVELETNIEEAEMLSVDNPLEDPVLYEIASRPKYNAAKEQGPASFEAIYDSLIAGYDSVNTSLLEEEADLQIAEEKLDVLEPFWDAYPTGMPVEDTYITSPYGYRIHPIYRTWEFHYGVDLKARYTPVYATGKGTVIRANYQSGYGYTVEIDHGYGYVTKYAHLSKFNVEVGDEVVRGQQIATSGSTGMSSGPHLHYEVRLDGVKIDPEPFLYDEEDN